MNCELEYVDANVENDLMDIDLPNGGFVADLEEIPRIFSLSIMLILNFFVNVSNCFTSCLICALKENDQ